MTEQQNALSGKDVSSGGQSEVARLMAEIETEYAAAQCGLIGVASGVSRHDFISAKYQRIGEIHQQLKQYLGEDDATEMMCRHLNEMEGGATAITTQ